MNKNLVNYSSSSEFSEDEIEDNQVDKKIKIEIPKKLKLPNYLKNTISENKDVFDDPNKHEGRIRSFPHERGNWTTYVYSKGPVNESLHTLRNQLNIFLENQVPEIQMNQIDHYHVSLTRTIIMRHHWIDAFTKSIREQISGVNKFYFSFNSLQIYCNDECTRTFIGLTVDEETSEYFENIVNLLNEILLEFKLPKFYTKPSFHMSILWCLGNQKLQLEKYIDEINKIFSNILNSSNENVDGNTNVDFMFFVIELYCKIGNKLFTFDLL